MTPTCINCAHRKTCTFYCAFPDIAPYYAEECEDYEPE